MVDGSVHRLAGLFCAVAMGNGLQTMDDADIMTVMFVLSVVAVGCRLLF